MVILVQGKSKKEKVKSKKVAIVSMVAIVAGVGEGVKLLPSACIALA